MPFDTFEQAESARTKMLSALDDVSCKTIGHAVQEFLACKQEGGLKPLSIKSYEAKLQFLPMAETLLSITRERAEELYRGQIEKGSVATHHKKLRSARALFEHYVKQRSIAINPFKEIRPIGKAKAGKLQLRRDEARKLSSLLLQHAANGNRFALALTVQVLLGLRSSELLNLRKRDLDADGTILIIEGTKTKNARRALSIESPIVRDLLAHRVASLTPESLIFGRDGSDQPVSNSTLIHQLHKFCKLVDVPTVCPHSLRGLHSSLAVEGGATSAIVATALGHGSDAVTLRHYIAKSAVDAVRSSRVAAALLEPDLDKLIASLRALPPAQLDRVLLAVGIQR